MLTFDKEVQQLIGRNYKMGIEEYLLEKAKNTGIQEGIEKGIEKGMKDSKLEIAVEFKKMGIPIEDIAKGTGLSIEEIEKL